MPRHNKSVFKPVSTRAEEALRATGHAVLGAVELTFFHGVYPIIGEWSGDPMRSWYLTAPGPLSKNWVCYFDAAQVYPTHDRVVQARFEGPPRMWAFMPSDVRQREDAEALAPVLMDVLNLRRRGV